MGASGLAMGFLALVIVLSGNATAQPSRALIHKGDIAPGAVTAKALARGAVRTKAIARGAVSASALAKGAVTSPALGRAPLEATLLPMTP